jgi:hypothetical protein
MFHQGLRIAVLLMASGLATPSSLSYARSVNRNNAKRSQDTTQHAPGSQDTTRTAKRLTRPNQRAQSSAARDVASLSAAERNKLPDATQVKLPSGHVTTLGGLRATHTARQSRFEKAAEMGRQVVPAAPVPAARPALRRKKASGGAGQSPSGSLGTLVALKPPSACAPGATVCIHPAKDYMDFCREAKATACLYLPSFTEATIATGWVYDIDFLIIDPQVCAFDGGSMVAAGPGASQVCQFAYPLTHTVNFEPTGQVTVSNGCGAPSFTYVFDPKGAVRISYALPTVSGSGTTFGTEGFVASCVTKVWIE